MGRYLIYFSYIGTKYCGVQSQNHTNLTTVHGVLRNVFQSLVPKDEVVLVCASRTDSGVHAMRAAAHIDLTLPRWRLFPRKYPRKFRHLTEHLDTPTLITKAVNRRLMTAKEDIRLLEVREVPETFHCREDAKWKKYLYRLAFTNVGGEERRRFGREMFPVFEFDRCTPLVNFPVDIDKLHEAAQHFVGTHDFATFAKPKHDMEQDTVRTIDRITINPGIPFLMNHQDSGNAYDFWDVEFKGKSFLWNQIRRITGAMVAVAGGRLSMDAVQYMIDNPSYLNWNNRASCLSGSGLYLKEIHFDEADLKMPDHVCDENSTVQSVTIEDSPS